MCVHHQLRRDLTMKFKASFLTRLVLACALVGIGIVTPAVAQSHRQLSSRVRHQLVGSWLVDLRCSGFRRAHPDPAQLWARRYHDRDR
jgi:hypothetical protein